MPRSLPSSRPLRAVRFHAWLAGSSRLLSMGLLLGGLASLPACGASPGEGAVRPGASLPAYGGEGADQFDDTIEPHAVGLALENYASPKSDPRLRARAQAADVVVRARVQTVTGESGSGVRSYQISFKTVERIAGKHPVGDEFTVRVDKSSPSLGIVKSMEGELVGKTLVIFAKAFGKPDGEREIHFHASADGPEVAEAVKEAVILDEVK
jgi:hypothetical protein